MLNYLNTTNWYISTKLKIPQHDIARGNTGKSLSYIYWSDVSSFLFLNKWYKGESSIIWFHRAILINLLEMGGCPLFLPGRKHFFLTSRRPRQGWCQAYEVMSTEWCLCSNKLWQHEQLKAWPPHATTSRSGGVKDYFLTLNSDSHYSMGNGSGFLRLDHPLF